MNSSEQQQQQQQAEMQKLLDHLPLYFFLSLLPFSCILPPSLTSSSSPLAAPEQPLADTDGSAQEEQEPQELQTHTQAAKPSRSNLGKVPKWLKLPGEDGHAH